MKNEILYSPTKTGVGDIDINLKSYLIGVSVISTLTNLFMKDIDETLIHNNFISAKQQS